MRTCKQCAYAYRAEEWTERKCGHKGETVRAEAIACEAFKLSARDFLESISRADKRLEDMSWRAKHYREIAYRATGSMEATRVSGTAGRSKVEHNINRCLDLAQDIDRQADALRGNLALAYEMIEGVTVPQGREVLELRYLRRLSWEEIAERMKYEARQTQRIHRKALREVQAQINQRFSCHEAEKTASE